MTLIKNILLSILILISLSSCSHKYMVNRTKTTIDTTITTKADTTHEISKLDTGTHYYSTDSVGDSIGVLIQKDSIKLIQPHHSVKIHKTITSTSYANTGVQRKQLRVKQDSISSTTKAVIDTSDNRVKITRIQSKVNKPGFWGNLKSILGQIKWWIIGGIILLGLYILAKYKKWLP